MPKQDGNISQMPQQASDPSNPASNFAYIYPKTDGYFYIKYPSGEVTKIQKITVGTVAPSSPSVGDLWVDTN